MPSCPEVALCVALSDLVQHRGGHRRVRHDMAWQGRVECSIAVFQDSEIAGSVVISAERSRVDTFRASSTKTWAISGLLLLGLFRVNLWRDVHTSLTCRSVQRYASRGEDHPTLPATTPKITGANWPILLGRFREPSWACKESSCKRYICGGWPSHIHAPSQQQLK